MTRPLILLTGLLLLCLFVLPSHGQTKSTTVHGQLVEVTSYVKDGIKPSSAAGKEIAMANLGKGGVLAMLENKTNRLYLIAPDLKDSTFMPRLAAYLGSKVFVKGPVVMRSSVRVITVKDIGKSLK